MALTTYHVTRYLRSMLHELMSILFDVQGITYGYEFFLIIFDDSQGTSSSFFSGLFPVGFSLT